MGLLWSFKNYRCGGTPHHPKLLFCKSLCGSPIPASGNDPESCIHLSFICLINIGFPTSRYPNLPRKSEHLTLSNKVLKVQIEVFGLQFYSPDPPQSLTTCCIQSSDRKKKQETSAEEGTAFRCFSGRPPGQIGIILLRN